MTDSKHTWVVLANVARKGSGVYQVRPFNVKARGEMQARQHAFEYAILQDFDVKGIESAERMERP